MIVVAVRMDAKDGPPARRQSTQVWCSPARSGVCCRPRGASVRKMILLDLPAPAMQPGFVAVPARWPAASTWPAHSRRRSRPGRSRQAGAPGARRGSRPSLHACWLIRPIAQVWPVLVNRPLLLPPKQCEGDASGCQVDDLLRRRLYRRLFVGAEYAGAGKTARSTLVFDVLTQGVVVGARVGGKSARRRLGLGASRPRPLDLAAAMTRQPVTTSGPICTSAKAQGCPGFVRLCIGR